MEILSILIKFFTQYRPDEFEIEDFHDLSGMLSELILANQ